MKINHIRLVTFAALASILFLQGMWLYNIYKLLETEFKKSINDLFITSIEKEVRLRLDDPIRIKEWEGKTVEGFHPKNDRYTNNRAFQDFLYNENYPTSLSKVDSIFKEEAKKSFDHFDYSILLTDSLNNKIDFLSSKTNFSERFAHKETIKLRNIAPEYITIIIASPYKIIFGKMLLMLIGSLIVVIFVIYCLIFQIRIIKKQDKIAKLRQDFTDSMVHDMKNPVTSILVGINALKNGDIDDKPQMKEHFYTIISQEGERILKLANKVLEIAHFEEQSVILTKEAINLPDLLEGLKKKYSSIAAKKVSFRFDLNGVETVYADPHYIYEAFDNLIDNAIKYSKENEDADLTITSFHKENETQLIFKDNGIGISKKDQEKIFEKFERSMSVISSRKKISGFGLGLNFVYQVIKAHGGTIWVNSKLGSYSEFIINLPTRDRGISPQ